MAHPRAAGAPIIHCDDTASVLHAIEAAWTRHHGAGITLGLYQHLAQVLNAHGLVIDAMDGLEILEHCRERNLPIIDILYALEDRVRAAGYRGGRLSLADFKDGVMVYVFFDSQRFKQFAEVKQHVAQRERDVRMPGLEARK